jgi:hypothetical protein
MKRLADKPKRTRTKPEDFEYVFGVRDRCGHCASTNVKPYGRHKQDNDTLLRHLRCLDCDKRTKMVLE